MKITHSLNKISAYLKLAVTAGEIESLFKKHKAFKNQNLTIEKLIEKTKFENEEDLINFINKVKAHKPSEKVWVLKQIKDHGINPEDQGRIKETLVILNMGLKDHINNWMNLSQQDIYKHEKYQDFKDMLESNDEQTDLPPGAKIAWQEGIYTGIIIKEPTASEILCKDSNWCVRHPETAENYLESGDLYLIRKSNKNWILAHKEDSQIMDRSDTSILDRSSLIEDKKYAIDLLMKFKEFNDLENNLLKYFEEEDVIRYFIDYFIDNNIEIPLSYFNYDSFTEIILNYYIDSNIEIPENYFNNPKFTFAYVKRKFSQEDFKNVPEIILKSIANNANLSLNFAGDIASARTGSGYKDVPEIIIKGIAQKPDTAYRYASRLNFKNVPKIILNSIAESTSMSFIYAESLKFKNIPDILINSIAQEPFYSIRYAQGIGYKDVPESIIKGVAQDPRYSYYYAKDLNFKDVPKMIINGIAKDPDYSLDYAESLNYENVPEIILNNLPEEPLDPTDPWGLMKS